MGGEVAGAGLSAQFSIADALRFERAETGLVRAVISTAAAEGVIYVHGAHIAQWKPRGERPVLFLSPRSLFAPGKAIRGGIPIIFPWFGARGDGQPGPAHGFARIAEWTIENTKLHSDGRVEFVLALLPNETSRGFGYDAFLLRFRVIFGKQLEIELETRNTASQPLRYEAAFHSYFAIARIHQASVSGLEGTTYIDKTDGFQRKKLGNGPLRFVKETDQVHLNTESTCAVEDPVWHRRIVIQKRGSKSTIVWNPWSEKTKELSDMDRDSWQDMVCVESGNVADNAIELAPGESRLLGASIRVESRGPL
jgi:glucose-6-phosphate 1-epimerase